MVIALAGRRIDEMDSDRASFPASKALAVKQKIADLFEESKATILVCSGANGADLLAHDAAMKLNLKRYMVLPFDPIVFKKTSVNDRPGDWDKLFDRAFNDLRNENILLGFDDDEESAFKKTNLAILDQADKVARATNSEKMAVIVWNGKPKSLNDSTEHFRAEALKRKYRIKEINTLT